MTEMITTKIGNMKKIPSVYYVVINLLAGVERCRDDDQYLICRVWLFLHPHSFIKTDINGRQQTLVTDLHSIANDFETAETITRVRRKIQNDLGLYPPTSQKIAKARRIKEEVWRENMQNNFTREQAEAIMEIFLRAKGANKKDLKEIKNQVINKYNI